MPIARREAEVLWEASLARGSGTLKSGSSALDQLAVTWASRAERPDGRTSPEELIAAAHASCFAANFEQVVGRAAELCPVSNALRGNVEISLRHELEGG
jgi:lipoyl-dependent peroxiredoxin